MYSYVQNTMLSKRNLITFTVCMCFMMESAYLQSTGSIEPMAIQVKCEQSEGRFTESTPKQVPWPHNVTIEGDDFMLDGVPLRIMSGSLHYFRLPAKLWRDRLRKLKAAGLNSVSTYVEWSFHEPEERQYSFVGDRDVAKFIRLAAEEGLHVLLRPGPYICAERDLGGFPYWLLGKYPNIKLRTTDKDFIQESKIWMEKLFEQVKPLLFGNGGPIILVQVENEYGSYGSDMAYKTQLRDIIKEQVGTNALLYTTDGTYASMFKGGAVPGALTTIDFGPVYSVRNTFSGLRRFMPRGPLMNSEFYPGWLTHWGESFQGGDTNKIVATLRDLLINNASVNFYVFFGGTNFEYTAGANFGGTYQPDITSYDYDAPITEAGDPTSKYFAIRDVLKQFNFFDANLEPPTPSQKGNYGKVNVSFKINLLSTEGRSAFGRKYTNVSGSLLPTFESLRQRAGLILYETTLQDAKGQLEILKPRDWIYVYVDNELKGVINRMNKKHSIDIDAKSGSALSLLVENQGRINYGEFIHDFKGILSPVTLNKKVLNGPWSIMGYPLEEIPSATPTGPSNTQGPKFYEGQLIFTSDQEPLDTFLDTTGWGKGYVWVNGYNLGRYWPGVGPQVTLYVPGVWLNAAPTPNIIQILELEAAPAALTVTFIDYPILNRINT